MKLKVLQLNINADNYFSQVSNFLKTHDFDIINLQEVAGKSTIAGNINCKIDCFNELKKILEPNYHSNLAISDRFSSDPVNSYMANATFFKKSITLISADTLVLHKANGIFPSSSQDFQNESRNAIILKLKYENKEFYVLNAHLVWGKDDIEKDFMRKQNLKLIEFVSKIKQPFILTGDFNISPHQPSILDSNKIATNLTSKYDITNTLNPRTHRAKHLFPKGLAVDYIFLGNGFYETGFKVLDNLDLSDHLGLISDVEL